MGGKTTLFYVQCASFVELRSLEKDTYNPSTVLNTSNRRMSRLKHHSKSMDFDSMISRILRRASQLVLRGRGWDPCKILACL